MKKLITYVPRNLTVLLTGGIFFAVGMSPANATVIEITKSDYNPGLAWATMPGTFHPGPTGVNQEDQETEPGTTQAQAWDLEAILFDQAAKKLYIVSGFNLEDGLAYPFSGPNQGTQNPGNADNRITPGDLFIKVGGAQPGFSPIIDGTGIVSNGTSPNYGYDYAVDLSLYDQSSTTWTNANFGPTADVWKLSSTSKLNTALWDQYGANPWKYNNDGTALDVGNSVITRTTFGNDALLNKYLKNTLGFFTASEVNVAAGGTAIANTAADKGFKGGGAHEILTVDLSFLTFVGTTVYFSYTMECGNDSLKGSITTSNDQVPDGSASILLIGLGLVTMFVARRTYRMI